MSTVKAINLQHPTSGNANIVLDTSGNIISNGNIGLGTSSPASKLHISVPNGYSSNGASRFTVNTNTKLSQHISSGSYGSSVNATFQYGISFSPSTSGTQSAIVISENGSDGTALGFFTTNSYAGGPNLNMSVLPNGCVTTPNQPYARVSKNNGNISGPAVIVFNYADDDPFSMYNATNGRFTAPITGRYLFTHGMFTNTGSQAWLKWRVNGSIITTTYSAVSSTYSSVAGCMILRMNAGDYADLYVETGGYVVYGGDRSQCWAVFTLLG